MSGYKTIWSVRGSKPCPGQAPAEIGRALAASGRSVVVVEADPAPAVPLFDYFGIRQPSRTLEDFLWGRVEALSEALTDTGVAGLRIISGAARFPRVADPAFPEKQRLIKAVRELDANHLIVDLGESASGPALDFFGISAEGILVIAPRHGPVQDSYNFLKRFVYRRLERLFAENPLVSDIVMEATDARRPNCVKTFPDLCEKLSSIDRRSAQRALWEIKSYCPKLLLDTMSQADEEAAGAFISAAKTYLGIEARLIGSVSEMAGAVRGLLGGIEHEPHSAVQVAPAPQATVEEAAQTEAERLIAEARSLQETFGFNDNVEHAGKVYHVQTEAQGGADPAVETVVYHGGRIFFSKKTPYAGAPQQEPLREFATRQHKAAVAAIRLNRISIDGR